jgi:hypothetical protein
MVVAVFNFTHFQRFKRTRRGFKFFSSSLLTTNIRLGNIKGTKPKRQA